MSGAVESLAPIIAWIVNDEFKSNYMPVQLGLVANAIHSQDDSDGAYVWFEGIIGMDTYSIQRKEKDAWVNNAWVPGKFTTVVTKKVHALCPVIPSDWTEPPTDTWACTMMQSWPGGGYPDIGLGANKTYVYRSRGETSGGNAVTSIEAQTTTF
jgi:hypothetical protein